MKVEKIDDGTHLHAIDQVPGATGHHASTKPTIRWRGPRRLAEDRNWHNNENPYSDQEYSLPAARIGKEGEGCSLIERMYQVKPGRDRNRVTQRDGACEVGFGELVQYDEYGDNDHPSHAWVFPKNVKRHEDRSDKKVLVSQQRLLARYTGVGFWRALRPATCPMPRLNRGQPLRPIWNVGRHGYQSLLQVGRKQSRHLSRDGVRRSGNGCRTLGVAACAIGIDHA